MALVPKNSSIAVKYNLSQSVVDELHAYAEWAEATRSKAVSVALKRLFSDDLDWQEHKTEEELDFN
jgi:hypothetical protein